MIGRPKLRLVVFAILVAPVAALISLPARALAATPPLSLTTTPVSIDATIHPGTAATETLQLMNNSSQAIPINMELNVFGAYGTSGQAAITAPRLNDPAASYVHFSPASFIAQPHVWSVVKATIKLPKTATLGYYYAVIFQPVVATPATIKPTFVKGSNAILILVDTQSANETRQVEIGSFSVSKKLYEYLPAQFTVSIHNTGNIFLAPTGDVYISRHSNLTNTIITLPVNKGGGNVLPDSYRVFQETWADGFPVFKNKLQSGQLVTDKKGNPVEQLQWNFANLNKIRFGKYYAGLTLIYNNGSRTIPLSAVVSFWVIPWKLLLLALVIVALFSFGFWSIGRSIFRRARGVRTKIRRKKT